MTDRAHAHLGTPSLLANWFDRRYAGVTVFVLVYLSIMGLEPFVQRSTDLSGAAQGDTLRQMLHLMAFGFTLVTQRLLTRPEKLSTVPLSFVLLLAFCALSVVWAIEPSVSMRRFALTAIIAVQVFVAVHYAGIELTQTMLRAALILLIFASYLVVLLMPQSGIHQPGEIDQALVGNWRGITAQKNQIGSLCAISILIFLFSPARVKLWLKWGFILATAFFLYKSQSKTSMGVLFVALAAGGTYYFFPRSWRTLLAPMGIVLLGMVLFLSLGVFSEQIAEYMSDPTALTGRTQIWPPLIDYIGKNPWTGAGFGSFWMVGAASPIGTYVDNWVAELGNGHNGYLDAAAQLGLGGAALAVFAVFIGPIWRILSSRTIDSRLGAMVFAILVFVILHNLTETTLLDRDAPLWVITLFAVALGLEGAKVSNGRDGI